MTWRTKELLSMKEPVAIDRRTSCITCGAATVAFCRTRDLNRRITSETFDYRRCPACGTISIAEPPANLGDYYAGDRRVGSLEELHKLAAREVYRLDTVRPFVKSGRCLEIGPNYGVFPLLAKQAGFDVDVVEMDEDCCRFLREVVKVNVVQSDEPEQVLPDIGPYDLIVMRHVFEHLPKPWECLEAAAKRLRPGGVLYIATPNPRALQLKVLGRRWPHLDAPRHLQLVPATTLVQRAHALGLVPVLLTCRDKGGWDCNVFGWVRVLMNVTTSQPLRLPLRTFGRATSLLMAPIELLDTLGAAYTVVFTRPPTRT